MAIPTQAQPPASAAAGVDEDRLSTHDQQVYGPNATQTAEIRPTIQRFGSRPSGHSRPFSKKGLADLPSDNCALTNVNPPANGPG